VIVILAGLYGYISATGDTVAAPPVAKAHTARTVAIWGGLWSAPLIALWLTAQDFLLQIGLFFSKLAVVTFGGAYAVLAYMTQEVVQNYGWITTGQMIDALGLAETTPGPLILVTEFVALLAGYAQGGIGMALAAGAVALWVTFTPCFLWIFAAGPYLDHIAARPRLSAALKAITSAAVGVIANLSVWFALHVLFVDVGKFSRLAMLQPVWGTLDPRAAALTGVALILMFLLRVQLLLTLALMAAMGCTLALVGFI
jgi:chromate transporter